MIQITNSPSQIETNQDFIIEGTVSDDLKGKDITIIVDNQFKSSAGKVLDNGSWKTNFIFLSPGNRRLTIEIEDESQTVNIEVISKAPRIKVDIPTGIETQKAFVLKGTADGFDDGEELMILVDGKFDVARPRVKDEKWEATLIFNQGGNRLVEIIASDQERTQIKLAVDTGKINVISRSIWGAAPPKHPYTNLTPKRITIHHTVIGILPTTASLGAERKRMRDIQQMHFNRGFSDIGYHYIIMPSGRIYEGRPNSKRGAHDVLNDGFGVAFDGEFHLAGSKITNQQFDSAVALCTQLCKRIGINDPTKLVPTKTAKKAVPLVLGPVKSLPLICGHRDRFPTDCPGNKEGKSVRLEDIRQEVKKRL